MTYFFKEYVTKFCTNCVLCKLEILVALTVLMVLEDA